VHSLFYMMSSIETLSDKSRLCVERLVRAGNELEKPDLWVLMQYEWVLSNRVLNRCDQPREKLAAVLVLLYEQAGELRVVLTTRSKLLRAHPGETSFPGGKVDENDPSLTHTAVSMTCSSCLLSRTRMCRTAERSPRRGWPCARLPRCPDSLCAASVSVPFPAAGDTRCCTADGSGSAGDPAAMCWRSGPDFQPSPRGDPGSIVIGRQGAAGSPGKRALAIPAGSLREYYHFGDGRTLKPGSRTRAMRWWKHLTILSTGCTGFGLVRPPSRVSLPTSW